MKNILLSLLVVVGINVAQAAEVNQETIVLADNTTFSGEIVDRATSLVKSTVEAIANPFLSSRDVECLARNIFYEAGSEPLEGKVAVGMVTLNRAQDTRYPQSVCGVVRQHTVVTVPQRVKEVKMIKAGYFSEPKPVVETRTTWVQKVVYQFSWVGQRNARIQEDDPRWIESKRVAEELARGGYEKWQEKYAEAMNFHAVYVNPNWKLKRICRVGNHIFYKGNAPG
jgi:spore germination cell wall hydrolase CwlJ-like protein